MVACGGGSRREMDGGGAIAMNGGGAIGQWRMGGGAMDMIDVTTAAAAAAAAAAGQRCCEQRQRGYNNQSDAWTKSGRSNWSLETMAVVMASALR